ncbi:hypothetical protein DSUL_140026 [Desulfovibrionales bacterium]
MAAPPVSSPPQPCPNLLKIFMCCAMLKTSYTFATFFISYFDIIDLLHKTKMLSLVLFIIMAVITFIVAIVAGFLKVFLSQNIYLGAAI